MELHGGGGCGWNEKDGQGGQAVRTVRSVVARLGEAEFEITDSSYHPRSGGSSSLDGAEDWMGYIRMGSIEKRAS